MPKVKVVVPNIVASATNGEKEVEIQASTVADAIQKLASRYGEQFQRRVLEPTGQPKRLLNFYVNGKNVRFLSNLDTRLSDGDELTFLPAVGGG